jgi:uncharacterized membrane protein YdfJ with MMPL/SSD domain
MASSGPCSPCRALFTPVVMASTAAKRKRALSKVRFRWVIVAAWVTAAVLATLFFPSLASVAKQNNTDLLPASSPSMHVASLATPFQGLNQTPVSVVIARSGGTLTTTDVTVIGRLADALAKVADVQQVKDLGVSADLALETQAGSAIWIARTKDRIDQINAAPGAPPHMLATSRLHESTRS